MDFEFERQYRCLECAGETILNGKIRAHAHVTACHSHLLATRHVDELLEQLPEQGHFVFEQEPPPPEQEVFYCCYCDIFRVSEKEIRGHIYTKHRGEFDGVVEEQRDFVARFEEPLVPRAARAIRTFDSITTVADFLTECEAADT